MKVFISWAGERSRKTAELLVAWLPLVVRDLEPWISIDTGKGDRSTPEISAELEKSKIGIICLTPENLNDEWILFEANALAKLNPTKVCTFLLNLQPSDIRSPLSQFQHSVFTKDDVFRLVQTINHQLPLSPDGKPIPKATLGIIFNHYWPQFEKRVKEIIQLPVQKNKKNHRLEVIEETVKRVDGQDHKVPDSREPVPVTILAIAERRYLRLVKETGVDPNEAIITIMNELDKKYSLQNDIRSLIFGHLMYFAHMKK